MSIEEKTALDSVGISAKEGRQVIDGLGRVLIDQGIPVSVLSNLKPNIYSNVEGGSLYYDLVINVNRVDGIEYRRRINVPLYVDEAKEIAVELKAWLGVLGVMA